MRTPAIVRQIATPGKSPANSRLLPSPSTSTGPSRSMAKSNSSASASARDTSAIIAARAATRKVLRPARETFSASW